MRAASGSPVSQSNDIRHPTRNARFLAFSKDNMRLVVSHPGRVSFVTSLEANRIATIRYPSPVQENLDIDGSGESGLGARGIQVVFTAEVIGEGKFGIPDPLQDYGRSRRGALSSRGRRPSNDQKEPPRRGLGSKLRRHRDGSGKCVWRGGAGSASTQQKENRRNPGGPAHFSPH